MICESCGEYNPSESRYCLDCGADLLEGPEAQHESQEALETTSWENFSPYYEKAIGGKSVGYYLPIFRRFHVDGVGVSWNWAAFFVSFFWLLYRKMWREASLYFLGVFLFIVIGGIVSSSVYSSSPDMGGVVFYGGRLAYVLTFFILFPMYANALYFKKTKKKVLEAESVFSDERNRLRLVSSEGGVSPIAPAAAIFAMGAVIAAIDLASTKFIPAYEGYVDAASTQGKYSEVGNGGYARTTLIDLSIDAPSMSGQRVEFDAELTGVGPGGFVGAYDPVSGNFVDILVKESESLSRDDKVFLRRECQEGCHVTVRGVAKDSVVFIVDLVR